jgi:hypothetical protein
MTDGDGLLAWIEPRDGGKVEAAFVAAAAKCQRAPATQSCSSASEAKRWVEDEAAALGAPVEWVDRPLTVLHPLPTGARCRLFLMRLAGECPGFFAHWKLGRTGSFA